MKKKLQPSKGKHLFSSGGRLVSTNSSLSSLPIYLMGMGMFYLSDKVQHDMNTVRDRFFCRGASDIFRYHTLKWVNVCLPKDCGSLGIINTGTMNDSLLLKWFWRLCNSDIGDQCCNLLRRKYWRSCPLAQCNGKKGSQFWKGLHKVKHKFNCGSKFVVGDGKNILF